MFLASRTTYTCTQVVCRTLSVKFAPLFVGTDKQSCGAGREGVSLATAASCDVFNVLNVAVKVKSTLSGSDKESYLRKSSILSLVFLTNPPNTVRQADKLIQAHVY